LPLFFVPFISDFGLSDLRANDLLVSVDPILNDTSESAHSPSVNSYRLTLFNQSLKDVSVIGVQKSCSCVSVNSLPVTLKSNQSKSLLVEIKAGSGSQSIDLFLYGATRSRNRVFFRQ
jgi:hypothetical protein